MSEAAAPRTPGPGPLDGTTLLEQLRHAWTPLPTATVFVMALGGLRVRLVRSMVTTLSIVLAIAFLTYTGLTHRLNVNLAQHVRQVEQEEPLDLAPVAESGQKLAALDLFATMPLDRQRRLAAAMDMDKVFAAETELAKVAPQVRSVRTERQDQERSLVQLAAERRELEPAGAADPAELGPIADEIAKAQARIRQLDEELARRQPQLDALQTAVALGKWIRSGPAEPGAATAADLAAALARRQQELLGAVSSPGRLSAQDLVALAALLDLVEARADLESSAHARRLRALLAQEQRKRDAAALAARMRRAGIDLEATLAGSAQDTWLIVMALITCAVGIANAMLMSVTERIREIGTMKCLGAQDNLVIKLFLLESGLLGAVGAVLGIVLGTAVALAAGIVQFRGFGASQFPLGQAWPVVLWSVLSGMVLAVCGAVYPAFAASRMRPVDALRVDE